jgi:hypothetical protein
MQIHVTELTFYFRHLLVKKKKEKETVLLLKNLQNWGYLRAQAHAINDEIKINVTKLVWVAYYWRAEHEIRFLHPAYMIRIQHRISGFLEADLAPIG